MSRTRSFFLRTKCPYYKIIECLYRKWEGEYSMECPILEWKRWVGNCKGRTDLGTWSWGAWHHQMAAWRTQGGG